MEAPVPAEIVAQLAEHGIVEVDEVGLRKALEAHVQTYTLIKLAAWPARRWKCHYRLMMGEGMYDAQSVAEAYARGLLAVLQQPSTDPAHTEKD